MEKTIVVVVLVIGVMSSRYWAMEAQVREGERVRDYLKHLDQIE